MSNLVALQTAIRARLVGAMTVTELVPSDNILDRHSRPAPDPSIILGEMQEVDEGRLARDVVRVYATLHVWKKEPSLSGAKQIAAAIRSALAGLRGTLGGIHIGDCYVSSARFLRDPDGETSHGIVTVEALISETT